MAFRYTEGEAYAIPGPSLLKSDLFVNPANDDFEAISYKLLFSNLDGTAGEPGMFLIDSRTGDMLTQPKLLGAYSVTLLASDADGAVAIVKAWQVFFFV